MARPRPPPCECDDVSVCQYRIPKKGVELLAKKASDETTTSKFTTWFVKKALSAAMEGRFRTLCLPWLSLSIVTIGVLFCAFGCTHVQAQGDSTYQYTRGPVPMVFQMNESYPARNETDECRPIRLRIQRNSRLFRRLVVNTNSARINFTHPDTRIMTSRLQTRLNALAELYYQQYRVKITVTKSWTEYGDGDVDDPQSLHYEGQIINPLSLLFVSMLQHAAYRALVWLIGHLVSIDGQTC